MSETRTFSSFEEFWQYYVEVHSHPLNRALHVGGTLTGLALAGTGILFRKKSLLVLAPIVGYGCSWIGHFFIEHNVPATFQHPVWSFMGDMKMVSLTLRRKMQAEVDRVLAEKAAREAAATPAAAEASDPTASTTATATTSESAVKPTTANAN